MQEFILKNLITIVFILLLIYNFIKGFNEGFLKKIVSFASLVITIFATKVLTPIVAEMIKDVTNIEATLSDNIYNILIETNTYDKFNIGGLEKIFNTGDLGNSLKNTLCTNIANTIINLVCGILIFIIVLFLVKFILKLLDVVDYIPVIGQFNKFLGGVLGAFELIIITWIILTVLKVLSSVPQIGVLVENIRVSPVVGVIYDNNIIYGFFSNLLDAFKKQ